MPLEDKTTMCNHYISSALPHAYEAIKWGEDERLTKIKQNLIVELQSVEDEPEAKQYLDVIQNNPWKIRTDLDKVRNLILSQI